MNSLLEMASQRLTEASVRDSTHSAYMYHLKRLVSSFHDRAGSLSTREIEEFLERTYRSSKSLAGMRQARSSIRFLYTRVLGKQDPLLLHGGFPARSPLRGAFTRGEISGILKSIPDLRYRTALMLVYSSGLTVEETTCLYASGVDLETPVIHVNDASGNPIRDTIVSSAVALEISLIMSTRFEANPLLLQGRGGRTRISPRTLSRAFDNALRATGIRRRAIPADLRFSFAVHLMEDGIDKALIKDLLGLKTDSMLAPCLSLVKQRSPLRIQSPLDRYFP